PPRERDDRGGPRLGPTTTAYSAPTTRERGPRGSKEGARKTFPTAVGITTAPIRSSGSRRQPRTPTRLTLEGRCSARLPFFNVPLEQSPISRLPRARLAS